MALPSRGCASTRSTAQLATSLTISPSYASQIAPSLRVAMPRTPPRDASADAPPAVTPTTPPTNVWPCAPPRLLTSATKRGASPLVPTTLMLTRPLAYASLLLIAQTAHGAIPRPSNAWPHVHSTTTPINAALIRYACRCAP
jgi:hypothetical protein